MKTHAHHHHHTERSGKIGAILSLICAIHCALMPLAVSLLPLLGMQFLASHLFEIILMGAGLGFGIYSVVRAYARHGRPGPLSIVIVGAVLVIIGLFLSPEMLEPLFVTTGALTIGAAQVLNIRLLRTCPA